MEWFYSGLLIALSGGITGFAGYLVVRLFRTGPVMVAISAGDAVAVPAGDAAAAPEAAAVDE